MRLVKYSTSMKVEFGVIDLLKRGPRRAGGGNAGVGWEGGRRLIPDVGDQGMKGKAVKFGSQNR